MTKRIVAGVALFTLVGILVAGAVIRTTARTAEAAERRGYGRNQESTRALGDATAAGQAQVDEWLALQGTVVSVTEDTLTVQVSSGEQVLIENRAWWFAQEQGFAPLVGDQVTLTAFYESGTVEVGHIVDLSSGQTVQLRDESGRPMWAGRGWHNG